MTDVVRSVLEIIQTCIDTYRSFHSMKEACLAFRSILETAGHVLDGVQQSINASPERHRYTRLGGPMDRLRAAVLSGEFVLKRCSTKGARGKMRLIMLSRDYTDKLESAGRDVHVALSALNTAGVSINISTADAIHAAKGQLDELVRRIDRMDHSVRDTVKADMESGVIQRIDQLESKLEAMGVVKDSADFHAQLNGLRKDKKELYDAKTQAHNQLVQMVLDLSMQDGTARRNSRPSAIEDANSEPKAKSKSNPLSSFSPLSVEDQLICPISLHVMEDPVMLVASGNTYNCRHLCQSLLSQPDLDPTTNQRYDQPLTFVPNTMVRSVLTSTYGNDAYKPYDTRIFHASYIREWKSKRGQGGKDVESGNSDDKGIDVGMVDDRLLSTDDDDNNQSHHNGQQRHRRRRYVLIAMSILVVVSVVGAVVAVLLLQNGGNDATSPMPPIDEGSPVGSAPSTNLTPSPAPVEPPLGPPTVVSWVRVGEINGEAGDDRSGTSVSLSSDGNILAIGSPRNDGRNNAEDVGHVRIFIRNGQEWTQQGNDITGEAAGDMSGASVSLSGDGRVVAIGASSNDGGGENSGHVRVFGYIDGSGWSQRGRDIDGESAGDYSGESVAISSDGRVVAIGAVLNGGNGQFSGHTRVYEYIEGDWVQRGRDIDGESSGDNSGFSVSLSSDGNIVAIGAWGNRGNGSESGHVRVHQYANGSWKQMGNDINGEAAFDNSGWSVSLSADGDVLAIGAPTNTGNGDFSGHVRIFEYNSQDGWIQRGKDIDSEAGGDSFGTSVSLSSDGTIMAVGAPENGGNGSNSGHVRVFKYYDGEWLQLGDDIDGEAPVDLSGTSVSLSADGSVVAIGAIFNDGNGGESGHVRVWEMRA